MSGSKSSAPESAAPNEAVSFTVHSAPKLAPKKRRLSGRMQALLVLAVCAAPVLASYFTYYVVRPGSRTNYMELIDPQKTIPNLQLRDLAGKAVPADSLKGQWLLVTVSGGACDSDCEKMLVLQRQLRETLGRERDRLEKVWLITDEGKPSEQVLAGANPAGAPLTSLRVSEQDLAQWLAPAEGGRLSQHLYLVDPMGNWMMRAPANPEPAKVKRDVERLLRASSSWDKAGR